MIYNEYDNGDDMAVTIIIMKTTTMIIMIPLKITSLTTTTILLTCELNYIQIIAIPAVHQTL